MKAKQILAIIAIVLLVGMYVSSLVFALIGSDWAQPFLQASVYMTMLVPIVLYAFTLAWKHRKKKDDDSEQG